MFRKSLVFFIASFLLTFFLQGGLAFAHTLKVDGSIGVVLHVDPEDDPVAGETATFYFDIKDKQGKFSVNNCDCVAAVLQEEVIKEKVRLSSVPSIQYIFPSTGIYKIELKGAPLQDGAFQAFDVRFDQRVAKGQQSVVDSSESHHEKGGIDWRVWVFGTVIFLFAIAWFYRRGRGLLSVLILLLALLFSQTGLIHAWCPAEHAHGELSMHSFCKKAPATTKAIEIVVPSVVNVVFQSPQAHKYSAAVASLFLVTTRDPPRVL